MNNLSFSFLFVPISSQKFKLKLFLKAFIFHLTLTGIRKYISPEDSISNKQEETKKYRLISFRNFKKMLLKNNKKIIKISKNYQIDGNPSEQNNSKQKNFKFYWHVPSQTKEFNKEVPRLFRILNPFHHTTPDKFLLSSIISGVVYKTFKEVGK